MTENQQIFENPVTLQVLPKNFYNNKILDFADNYSKVIMVAFGVSTFCFNLGSNRVLNKKFMVWAGIVIIVLVISFLLLYNKDFLLKKEENTFEI